MANTPKLGNKPKFEGNFDGRDVKFLEKVINRQVHPSNYGVILPPSFLRREGLRSDVQYAMLAAAYNRVAYLCDLAADTNKKDADRMKAVAILLQYGVGEKINVTLTDSQLLRAVCRVLAHEFTQQQMDTFLDSLDAELKATGE